MEKTPKNLYSSNREIDETKPFRARVEHKKRVAAEYTHEQRLVRSYLESLDVDTLRDIFAHYVQKSGNASETMNFFPPEKIPIVDNHSTTVGMYEYNQASDYLFFNAHHLAEQPKLFLYYFIHEQLHAAALVAAADEEKHASYSGDTYIMRTGFEQAVLETGQAEPAQDVNLTSREHIPANEGFTDYLTHKIATEYFARTGDAWWYGDVEGQETENFFLATKYRAYTLRTEAYMQLLQILSGAEEDTIEEAMIRAYFRNTDIVGPEVTQLLQETHPALPDCVHSILNDRTVLLDCDEMFRLAIEGIGEQDPEAVATLTRMQLETAEKWQDFMMKYEALQEKRHQTQVTHDTSNKSKPQ